MQLTALREPVSLDKFAYDSIKEAILTFQLLPGQNLVESELADQLKISKTPVRSALLRLEREGLVVKSHYKGATVTEITPQGMIELFRVRSTLEGLAARMVAEKAQDEEIAEIQLTLDDEQRALKEHRPKDASDANVRFHKAIITFANNPWLTSFLANLDDHLRRYRMLSNYQAGRLDKSVVEHRIIMDAILGHDGEHAEAAMKDHLISVMRDLDHQNLETLIKGIERG